MRAKYRKLRTVVIIFFLLALATWTLNPRTLVIPSARAQSLGPCVSSCVAVAPTAVADTSKTSGSVTFEVNITNAPAISFFLISLQYNTAVLSASQSSVEFSNNVLGVTEASFECINGNPIAGNCSPSDRFGVVSLGLSIFGPGATTPPTFGKLFNVTFAVSGVGVSELHFVSVILANAGAHVDSTNFDGYFSNKLCGSAICRPPVADFTVSPPILRQGVPATFDASASVSRNPSGTIADYHWDWQQTGLEAYSTPNPVTRQTYSYAGNYTVTLRVNDTYGITGSASHVVQVTNVVVDTGIKTMTVTPEESVLPGTPVNITAIARNYGTSPANITLSIFIEGNLVKNITYRNVPHFSDASPTLSYRLDTSGLKPDSYRIDSSVSPQIGDNNTRNDLYTDYVQIIEPRQSSLINLSLLPAASLTAILVLGGGFGVITVRRKLKPDLDAL